MIKFSLYWQRVTSAMEASRKNKDRHCVLDCIATVRNPGKRGWIFSHIASGIRYVSKLLFKSIVSPPWLVKVC